MGGYGVKIHAFELVAFKKKKEEVLLMNTALHLTMYFFYVWEFRTSYDFAHGL